jgi:hypothetical protein
MGEYWEDTPQSALNCQHISVPERDGKTISWMTVVSAGFMSLKPN